MIRKNKAIIFSKDRPMQCLACIDSLFEFCFDIDNLYIDVLFDYSNDDFLLGYQKLESNIVPSVRLLEQKNFKKDLLNIIYGSDYLLFLVDDNLFVDYFYIKNGIKFLNDNDDNISFSYRMGLNINYCYPADEYQKNKNFEITTQQNIIKTKWDRLDFDWNYPMDLSSSLYRTKDINEFLCKIDYNNPNELEYYLDACKFTFYKPYFGSYNQSVAFCNPINKVNKSNNNRSGNKTQYSTENLLYKFLDGYKIDISKFYNFIPNSPHQEVEIEFIK
jgi:hypothetical protein